MREALRRRVGRTRAIRGWKIAEKIGLGTGEHAVSRIRGAVWHLRRQPQARARVIVAAVTPDELCDEPGYFYAKTPREYQRYMGPFRQRALDILETVRHMDEGAELLWGAQARLDQVETGQLEMALGDPEHELADAGGPRWYEVGESPWA